MADTKPYQVMWSHTAQQDLTEIIEYIAQDSVANALEILEQLKGVSIAIVFTNENTPCDK